MTEIFAHRGSKGTHPENTLPAFVKAVKVGSDGIELDVQLTKDKQLVVIHDESIDRTTNGKGLVANLTLAELKKVDAGSWFHKDYKGVTIPTLAEVFDLLTKLEFTGTVNIELKTDKNPYEGIEEKVVELVNGVPRNFSVMYSSFNFETLRRLHQIDAGSSKAWITYGRVGKKAVAKDYEEIDSIHPNLKWFLKAGRSGNGFPKKMRPWTVNKTKKIKECILQGATAIHTDFPELAIALRAELLQANSA